jgi:hypothetical protein
LAFGQFEVNAGCVAGLPVGIGDGVVPCDWETGAVAGESGDPVDKLSFGR